MVKGELVAQRRLAAPGEPATIQVRPTGIPRRGSYPGRAPRSPAVAAPALPLPPYSPSWRVVCPFAPVLRTAAQRIVIQLTQGECLARRVRGYQLSAISRLPIRMEGRNDHPARSIDASGWSDSMTSKRAPGGDDEDNAETGFQDGGRDASHEQSADHRPDHRAEPHRRHGARERARRVGAMAGVASNATATVGRLMRRLAVPAVLISAP